MEPESYLDFAGIKWLPRRREDPKYERALFALATRFEVRHGDRWLKDALSAPVGERDSRGLAALSEALQANLSDDSDRALAKAAEAAGELRGALALRAGLEQIYALHRTLKADECIAQAVALERKLAGKKYSWILAQTILERGICHDMLGDSGIADAYMLEALAQVRKAGYRDIELRAEGVLAGQRTEAGNLLVAWNLGREALASYWRGPHSGIRAQQIYFNLLRSAENLGMPHTAYVFAKAAALALAETPRRRSQADARAHVARLAIDIGQPEEAAVEFERAAGLFDRLSQTKTDRQYRAFAELYRAQAGIAAGNPSAALSRLEAIRPTVEKIGAVAVTIRFHQTLGDAFWRDGKSSEAERAYGQAIELYERRLSSLRGSQERASAALAAGKSYRGLTRVYWARGDKAGAWRQWERFRAAGIPEARDEMKFDDRLPQLRNESFLSYAILPDGVVAWLYDDRGVEGHPLTVKPEELDRVASRFLRECADRGSSPEALQRDTRQLYDWLIGPFAHRFDPERTLVIEPDGAIGAIPMQALMDRNFEYLGRRFAMTTAAGLVDYQRREAADPVTSSARALIVADPVLGKEMALAFPPLRSAIAEGEAIRKRFDDSVLIEREGATLAGVEKHRPGIELFHFAGHGFSNAGNGGLLLAPGEDAASGAGVLDAARLTPQSWSRCRLAVLSACSTGTGESRGPVNPESLVRGLLWAGAARVVATRWNVDAETSLPLMDGFYEALLAGSHASKALQKAAGRVRTNKSTSHPYYWAGFQSYGAR